MKFIPKISFTLFFSECLWQWCYITNFFILDFIHCLFLKCLQKSYFKGMIFLHHYLYLMTKENPAFETLWFLGHFTNSQEMMDKVHTYIHTYFSIHHLCFYCFHCKLSSHWSFALWRSCELVVFLRLPFCYLTFSHIGTWDAVSPTYLTWLSLVRHLETGGVNEVCVSSNTFLTAKWNLLLECTLYECTCKFSD
jgi:hypothetical protein